MDYSGPHSGDLVDIAALNRAYLEELRKGLSGWEYLPAPSGCAIRRLTDVEIARLAGAPFLLLSVREHDAKYWDQLLDERSTSDLFLREPPASEAHSALLAAALAYIWQLARHNVYAARLACGADTPWCETLADRALMELLACCRGRCDMLQPRCWDNAAFWRRLLLGGISETRAVRQAAHLTALQTMQMHVIPRGPQRLDAAACRIPAVPRQVAKRFRRR